MYEIYAMLVIVIVFLILNKDKLIKLINNIRDLTETETASQMGT